MHVGLVGAGASSVYLLNKMLKNIRENGKVEGLEVSIFEKGAELGVGMPYSASQVDRVHLVNILPEETPELLVKFDEWLKQRSDAELEEFGIPNRDEINSKAIYRRIALGRYLKCQYEETVAALRAEGVTVNELSHTAVVDAIDNPDADNVTICCANGKKHTVDKMVIATGHVWPEKELPNARSFKSPWPIDKIVPKEGEKFDFPVALLGASLSAFDVLSSLADRHGHFERRGSDKKMVYIPDPGTENFEMVLHTSQGKLPHVRCEFQWPHVQQHRFFSAKDVEALADNGVLRIEDYFQKFCKAHLVEDLRKDGLERLAAEVEHPSMTLKGFVNLMNAERRYDDPFDGMKHELEEAKHSVASGKPIHWKETLDDLMYTLNAHAHQLPAEDLRFYQTVVIPFVLNVTAFLPHESAEKLLAL